MKTELSWKTGMIFSAVCDSNNLTMDAKPPLGQNQGMTPKELVATGLGGCTAMDVVALLKKHKQNFESFDISVDVIPSNNGHPIIFKDIHISFKVTGAVDPQILIDSVALSQTKYCGVSAMLSKTAPINYSIYLNGAEINKGKAQFEGSL